MSTPQSQATLLIAPAHHAPPVKTQRRAPAAVLAGLWIMDPFGVYTGLQQHFLPRVFYDRFPGFGMTWVSPDGPFNEHVMRDLDGANLAPAVPPCDLWRGLPHSSIARAPVQSQPK